MMKRIITLLLLFLSLSCEGQEPTKIVNITTDYIKTFDIRNSPRIVYSDSTSSIYPVFMIDDIICITHPRKGNRFAIDFIKSDSHENLGHCIDFESSGNDWLAPLFYICDNSIIVHDNTTRQIAIVDVAQACRDKDYTPFIHETNIVTTRIIPYQEKILFWNPYGHDPHYPRVLLSDINWQYTDTLKYNFNALNIGHGELMLDAGQSIISFVHKREPVIDLIGLDGGLLSSLHFEHPSTEIVSFKQNSTITYIYKQPLISCFSAACSSKDFFAVSFNETDGSDRILMIDWEGNILSGFKASNKVISLSVSNDGKMLYSWEQNGNIKELKEYAL